MHWGWFPLAMQDNGTTTAGTATMVYQQQPPATACLVHQALASSDAWALSCRERQGTPQETTPESRPTTVAMTSGRAVGCRTTHNTATVRPERAPEAWDNGSPLHHTEWTLDCRRETDQRNLPKVTMVTLQVVDMRREAVCRTLDRDGRVPRQRMEETSVPRGW